MTEPNPGTSALEPFFSPYRLGPLLLRNRFVMSPMQKFRPADLVPTKEQEEYYRQRGGAVGMIVTQGTTIDDPTSESPYARFFPASYAAWQRCAAAVSSNGGHLVLQLWHEGGQRAGGWSPSGRSSSGRVHGQALSIQQIEALIAAYGRAATHAERLGFAGVELHAGHGYLLGQFMGPLSNRREDEYGGDLDGRMRFPLAVVRAVRASVRSDFPIGLRTSLWSGADGTRPTVESPEELAVVLRGFVAAGVDYFSALKLRFWTPEFEGSDLSYAGWIRRLTGMPTIAGGSVGLEDDLEVTLSGGSARSNAPVRFVELVRRFHRGDFDLVSLGRTILMDPGWLDKVRSGRLEQLAAELHARDILTGPTNPERIVYG